MRRLGALLALALCGLLVIPAWADQAAPELAPATAAPPVPLLWKISKGEQQIYLLGSFHVLKPEDYPLSGDVDRAYADSGRLVFELAPEEVASPELAQRMLQAGQRTGDDSLRDELGATLWGKLESYAQAHAMPLQSLQAYKPWFVGLTVSLASMGQQGMQSELGLDRHFMDLAARDGKPASGLERADEQIALLDGMTPDEQRQMLAEALDDGDDGDVESARLHDAWRRGDAAGLWDGMAMDMRRKYPALYRSINIERNQRWVPQLEQLLQAAPAQGRALVVVGALHLLGSDGVVELLRRQGYSVQRICSACPGR